MCHPDDDAQQTTHTATVYRITVEGRLDASWEERLGGLKVMSVEREGRGPEKTVLLGPLRDQAALAGVLNALHGLRLKLLGVEALTEEQQSREGDET